MGVDMTLYAPTKCPNCGAALGSAENEIHWQNITHNVIPMWNRAGVFEALYEAHGRTVDEAYISTLRAGVKAFEADYAEFEKLDSPNGWGRAKNALPWLKRWLEACEQNKGALIHVSR